MPSLSNIPEPTTGFRPDDDAPAPQAPLQTLARQADEPVNPPVNKPAKPVDDEEPQQQIDSVSCLLVLLIAGAVLRAVLGFFGPLQGLDPASFDRLARQGKQAFSDNPVDASPLPGLLAAGLSTAGAPGWVMVLLGSLLALAAVPAAFVIGRAATGRRAAGILAAALVAVHPAVLTACNTLSGSAIALGLLTLGLALSLHAAKRGLGFAVAGGAALGLAALTAPLLWVAAALAGPFAGHVALKRGPGKAVAYAVIVFVLALGPVAAYRVIWLGPSTDAVFAEFNHQPTHTTGDRSPTDRLLITLTDPSLAELGEALRLPVGDAGRLAANTIGADRRAAARPDPVADILADGWLLMNAALASLATVSIGVMLSRRRFIETAVLAAPLIALGFVNAAPGEVLRLPMIALVGVLAAGLLANKPAVERDEEALAKRAERKAAKQSAREERQLAKQERDLNKDKGKLYAFDQPTRREKKARKKQMQQQAQPTPPTGILTERITDESSIPARPI